MPACCDFRLAGALQLAPGIRLGRLQQAIGDPVSGRLDEEQRLSTTVPFNSLGLPDSLLAGTSASPTDLFIVSQPVNSSGGRLKGFEVNVQQPFSFLPGFLSNFGVLANYTHVTSNIRYLTSTTGGASVIAPLLGLSKHAANGTLYFETAKFQIRGSIAYRSRYLAAVPGTEGNAYNGTSGTTNVDARCRII